MIHTKKRNKLSTAQLDRLVYVNANLKLLRKGQMAEGPKEINPDLMRVEIQEEEMIHPAHEDDEIFAFLEHERALQQRGSRARSRARAATASTSARAPPPVSNSSSSSLHPPTLTLLPMMMMMMMTRMRLNLLRRRRTSDY